MLFEAHATTQTLERTTPVTALPEDTRFDSQTRIVRIESQYDARLLGVPAEGIRLSWAVESDDAHAEQRGYQLKSRAGDAEHWQLGAAVTGSDAIGIAAPGTPLASRERRDYSVRIATESGWTEWSDALTVEAGIVAADLVAKVIDVPSAIEGPVPTLRREFELPSAPVKARLYLSSLGVNEMHINGVSVSDEVLAPGWTSYTERIVMATHDVTELLHGGTNAIAGIVGDGWYRGRMGFIDRTAIYGDRIGLIAQLELLFADGSTQLITTDTDWRGGFTGIESASIYDGTAIDLRLDAGDPSTVGFDDSQWASAAIVPADLTLFEPRIAAPVRVIAELPMAVSAASDRVMLDSGQNISGWVRLVVDGQAGDVVTVRHAEVLEPSGALHTAALRSAKATDVYTLAAAGETVLEPVFTFHGFQYADVVSNARVVSATAIAISSDLAPRSSFESAHEALNQLHSNVSWSQRDNFVSLPTDCPQRDERLGWTGDAQAFAATANTLFDSEAFWRSWLRDVEIDQAEDGGVSSIVPDIIRAEDLMMGDGPINPMGRAGWADAATVVPLSVYEAYGSDEVLVRQLDSMRRWVGHLRQRAGDGIVLPTEPFQYGDWLDPDAPGDRPWQAKVSSDFVANAFYVQSTRLLATAERLVGDAAAAEELESLARVVSAESWRLWRDEAMNTQTGAALALEFGIAPDAERQAVAEALAANVRAENGRIATGFLGTPLVLFALSHNGHSEEAFQMLLRREAPSWLYQVDRGATTVWERWDAILPDGSIHAGDMDSREGDSMISFNHYAYGAVIDWVYRVVAGLAPDIDAPGYALVHVAPRPAVGLDWARAAIETRLGTLSIDWALSEDGVVTIELHVPFGSTAALDLPVTADSTVTINGRPATATVGHGRHTIIVSDAAVVVPAGQAVSV